MTETPIYLARNRLKTPRAAAVAGILFALLYGTGLTLIRISIPSARLSDSAWLETNARTVALALNMVPYAGIAFLWFIGVIRDRMGDLEDRFFSTVFLGSGLLFLAMNFVGATLASGLLTSYELEKNTVLESGVYTYSRGVMFNVINIYAVRMAGLFMSSLGTIWLRTGLMPRFWTYLTYALSTVLLVTISFSAWVPLIFPAWVFAVSIYILITNLRAQPQGAARGI
jgi:hypothetical protein